MAIGFGNGGNLIITGWTTLFQSVQPFQIQHASGDITSIDSANGVLRKMIGSGRGGIQPQTAAFFFDPEGTEPAFLTDGSLQTAVEYKYPDTGTFNRKGDLYINGYQDGGLLDDEIMVGEVTLLWEGGVTLAAMTNIA